MPLFYFDVREDQCFLPDEEGIDFPNLDAAEIDAAEAAAEIGLDLLPNGKARSVSIEVRNELGQRVLTVTVSLKLERVEPSTVPTG